MKINKAGLELIKHFEGCKLTAYKCPAGIWTIGVGHTGDVKEHDVITQHQADVILQHDLERFEAGVLGFVTVPVTENEFSALVSFAFNLGVAALARSSLLKLINGRDAKGRDRAKDTLAAADAFKSWVYAAGKVLPGLVARRTAERELFLKP